MSDKPFSRRAFIKKNSLAGAGLALSAGWPPFLLSPGVWQRGAPALLGGLPEVRTQWPKWPLWHPETDDKRVLEALRSGVWSRKKTVDAFEKKWAEVVGAKRCLTVVNGTNALIVALLQMGIGAGDEVLIPPYTYIATAQAVLATGALPVFVDTDPVSFQMDVAKIEAQITARTRAIVPVHLAGVPIDMARILDIAQKRNLVVVEDACQAHLAEIQHQQVGTWGHAGCFSFQNSKNLPIGEGGAIVSNDHAFMDRCYAYHNLGFAFGSLVGHGDEGSVLNGNKLRITEYQAAIGLAQLDRLEEQTQTRTKNGEYLRTNLKEIPGISPILVPSFVTRAVYHLFPFRYQKEAFQGLSRAGFLAALNAEGVPCYSGYTPLNRMPFLKDAFESKNFKRSYSQKQLHYGNYLARNSCPHNDRLCGEEAVWFTQNLLLAGEEEMKGIVRAVAKIQEYAETLKKSQP